MRRDRIAVTRVLLPVALAALFPVVQLLTSGLSSLSLGIALEPQAAGQLASTPEYLLGVAALSQLIAVVIITWLGRPIFMPSFGGRARQLRRAAALLVPVLLLTLGVQFLEAGTLALLDVDLGRYEEIADLILQADLLVVLVAVALIPGICEELVFREVIQPATTYTLGAVAGIVYTSLLFAIVHMVPVQIFAAFLFGLVFGYIRYRSKSVYPAIVAHIGANALVIIMSRAAQHAPGVDPHAVETTAGPEALFGMIGIGAVVAALGVWLLERKIRKLLPR